MPWLALDWKSPSRDSPSKVTFIVERTLLCHFDWGFGSIVEARVGKEAATGYAVMGGHFVLARLAQT
jgi:hypothetical protein